MKLDVDKVKAAVEKRLKALEAERDAAMKTADQHICGALIKAVADAEDRLARGRKMMHQAKLGKVSREMRRYVGCSEHWTDDWQRTAHIQRLRGTLTLLSLCSDTTIDVRSPQLRGLDMVLDGGES